MKYTTTHLTYDPNDCTDVGWKIESHETRARLTRHNRWQGSRGGAVFLVDIDGPLSEEDAEALAMELTDLIDRHAIRYAKGSEYDGFRCTQGGFTVR